MSVGVKVEQEMSQGRTIRAVLVCDESGAKGYATQREQFPGEVGVMAGILMHEEIADDCDVAFQRVYDEFKPSTVGKLHMADLDAERQGTLRNEIYRTVGELGLPCFWYAIHVEGLFNAHEELRRLMEENKPPPSPRFKQSSPREAPALMHEELFNGLFSRVLAFVEGSEVENVAFRIKTDRVDRSTVKRFEAAATRFLDDGPLESRATALDTETGQIVRGGVTVDVDWSDSMKLRTKVAELKVECAEDGVTLAADVLANSLNNVFVTRGANELYGPLNRMAAVRGHPLVPCFDLFGDQATGDLLGDRLRAHPKAPRAKLGAM